jgi:hypothetical protein
MYVPAVDIKPTRTATPVKTLETLRQVDFAFWFLRLQKVGAMTVP